MCSITANINRAVQPPGDEDGECWRWRSYSWTCAQIHHSPGRRAAGTADHVQTHAATGEDGTHEEVVVCMKDGRHPSSAV